MFLFLIFLLGLLLSINGIDFEINGYLLQKTALRIKENLEKSDIIDLDLKFQLNFVSYISGDVELIFIFDILSPFYYQNITSEDNDMLNFSGNEDAINTIFNQYNNNISFDIKEAYVKLYLGDLDIIAGKKIYNWGVCNNFSLNNRINPADEDGMYLKQAEDISLGVYSINLRLNLLDFLIEFVCIPYFTNTKLPLPGSMWGGEAYSIDTNITQYEIDASLPSFVLTNMEYAGRISMNILNFDLALLFYDMYERKPVFLNKIDMMNNSMETKAIFGRKKAIGSCFNIIFNKIAL